MHPSIQPLRARRTALAAAMTATLIAAASVSVYAADEGYDLTERGSSATIEGATFMALTRADVNKRRGFRSFVRIGKPWIAQPQGYNTDYRPVQFDERRGPRGTRALLLSHVPQVQVAAETYRAFELDISQRARADKRYLTLDELQVFESSFAALCGYPFDGSGGGHSGCTTDNTATLVWDMDNATDRFVVLDYRNNPGRGRTDLRVLIPDGLFDNDPDCAAGGSGCGVYVTLYSAFGGDADATSGNPLLEEAHRNNAGFESWGVRRNGPRAAAPLR